jgi:phosphoglycolate phosphatase
MTIHNFIPKAIFFDLDGTLIESAPEITDAVNDTLTSMNWSSIKQSLVTNWIGHGTTELMINALAHTNQISTQQVRQSTWLNTALNIFKNQYKVRCGSRSHLYPFVAETLELLKRQGIRLAVITNKESIYTDIVLDVHQIKSSFDLIISGDTLPTKKPDPQGIFYCLSQWNLSPQDALFVGDSCIDAQTAKAGGLPAWLVPYGYNMGRPIQECTPNRIILDFSQLQFNKETNDETKNWN